MSKKREIERLAEESFLKHRMARSNLFLEAAIASLLEVYSVGEVASLLREQAAHLDEFS
ncbi:MAG: hypothetical protein ACOZAM_25745 [Pseudomonadota bacterium]